MFADRWRLLSLVSFLLMVSGCSGGGGGNSSSASSSGPTTGGSQPANTYFVGATTYGLTSTGLVLQNNGSDSLFVIANGLGYFAIPLATGTSYSVTISNQPAGQACTVTSGTGTLSGANVVNIQINCSAVSSPITSTATISSYMNSLYAIDQVTLASDVQTTESFLASQGLSCSSAAIFDLANLKETHVLTFLNAAIADIKTAVSKTKCKK